MVIELVEDVVVRAERHAALGDPTRLRIVDALAIGDRSPGQLGEELSIASNLLAHHLKVLQTAHLVVRVHSESDRRRTYVRLRYGAWGALATSWPHRLETKRVLFVCTANSARSQLAQALWREVSDVPATSAGTYPSDRVHSGALSVARRHGLTLAGHRPRALAEQLDGEDLIVTVCDSAAEELATLLPIHWSIPDPVRVGTSRAFEAAYDELVERVSILSAHVSSSTGGRLETA